MSPFGVSDGDLQCGFCQYCLCPYHVSAKWLVHTQVCKIPAGIQKDLSSSNIMRVPYGGGGVGRIAAYVYGSPCELGERTPWHGYGGFPICSCGNTGLCHSVGEAESGGEGGAETDAGRSPSGRAFRQITVTIAGFGCGMNDIAKIQKEVRSK